MQKQISTKRIVLFLFLISTTISYFLFSHCFQSPVSAQDTANYDWAFNLRNFYVGYALEYQFSNLDSGHQYIWRIETYDIETGIRKEILGHWLVTAATTHETIWTDWPLNTFTGVRIIDDFGQVLGEHFLAPQPLGGSFAWEQNETHATGLQKTAIGIAPQLGVTTEGHLHDGIFSPEPETEIVTQLGNFTLLQYRADFDAVPLDDNIEIRKVSAAQELLARYDIEFLADFNTHPDYDWGLVNPAGTTNYLNFVLLSTGCDTNIFDIFALCLDGNDTGIYEYARIQADDTVLANGESIWIINNTSLPEISCEIFRPRLIAGDIQRVAVTNHTENVWESYRLQFLDDDFVGIVGADLLAETWGTTRHITYTTANIVASTIPVLYVLDSEFSTFFPFVLDLDDYRLITSCGTYATLDESERTTIWRIIEDVTPDDDFIIILGGAIGVVLFLAFIFAKQGINPKFYLLVFMLILSLAMIQDLFPTWLDVISAIIIMIGIVLLLRKED